MRGNDKTPANAANPKPEVFDLTGTLRRLGGDINLLSDLVQLYNEDSPALLNRLRSGVESHRGDEVRHAAHSLRGLAANFGAAPLMDSLLRMEAVATDGCWDEAPKLLEQVGEKSARLQATLALHRR